MTDEEILKRLAEIEGYKLSEYGFRYSTAFNAIIHYQDDDFSPWNPLHDDAQCLALVKKHNISLEYLGDTGYGRKNGLNWLAAAGGDADAQDETLNRSVCLAIIEAHK